MAIRSQTAERSSNSGGILSGSARKSAVALPHSAIGWGHQLVHTTEAPSVNRLVTEQLQALTIHQCPI